MAPPCPLLLHAPTHIGRIAGPDRGRSPVDDENPSPAAIRVFRWGWAVFPDTFGQGALPITQAALSCWFPRSVSRNRVARENRMSSMAAGSMKLFSGANRFGCSVARASEHRHG